MPEATPSDSTTESQNGVQIDLISGSRMEGLRSMEKIRLILEWPDRKSVV